MRWFWALAGVAILASCAAVPIGDERPLPIAQVLEEVKGLPYECGEYDPVSDTCATIAVSHLKGSRLSFITYMATSIEGVVVVVKARGRGFISSDARACLVENSFRSEVLSDIGPVLEPIMEEFVDLSLNAVGGLCGEYYRGPNGTYLTRVYAPDGTELVEGRGSVRFFAERPKLRATPIN